MQRDPEGYFLISINVLTYPGWSDEFPDEAAMNAEGKAATSREGHLAPASYYSNVYRAQVMDMLRAYVQHIKAQPYSRAVAGFMLSGGEDTQFYYQVVKGQQTIQDGHSPGDLPLFRAWLRKHYTNDLPTLRATWNEPEVTFENAEPHISSKDYPGVFFDVKTQTHELDMQRFLNEEVAHLLVDGLTVCKQEIGKPVIGVAYYGRGMSALPYPQSTVRANQRHAQVRRGGLDGGATGILRLARNRKRRDVELGFRFDATAQENPDARTRLSQQPFGI